MNIPFSAKFELYKYCYLTNNNFAYKYDKWCLNCSTKDVDFRCGKCKSVFFCDVNCQKKCWKIHKNIVEEIYLLYVVHVEKIIHL